ncbi:hypothetical protein [Cupriavidus sp. TMH.W2]|uniref:hypothetical protein n=1 Tax=Cupriavidus sp. TMH.W2 TaxID=3434465 RepID=UPI003D772AE7
MKKTILSLVCLSLLAGCAAPMQEVKDAMNGADASLDSISRTVAANSLRDDAVVHRVSGAWLGGKAIPVSSEATLPEIFRQPYEFRELSNRKINLAVFARLFTNSTGIPVRIGDVYGANRGGQGNIAAAATQAGTLASPIGPTGAPIPIATGTPLTASSTLQVTNPTDPTLSGIDLFYTKATPERVLNDAMSQWNLNWQWQDGAVVISKYITRKFSLKMPTRDITTKNEIGKSSDSKAATGTAGGASGGGIQTGFTSASTITATATLKAFDELIAELQGHLRDTTVTANRFDGTITVTGSRDNIATAQKMIDRTNEIVSRSAKLNIAVYQIKNNKGDEYGVNWNIVFQNLAQRFGFNLVSPASVVSANAAGVTFNILTPSGGTPGQFNGSTAVLNALHSFGDVVTLRQLDVLARNRRPTPVNITTQTSYLAQTTPATATQGGTGGIPGLTPGVVTTGFAANVEANINDSNQINLSLSMGIVDLVTIDKFGTGTGATAQMIQLPVTSGFEFQQDVDLRPGEVLVLTGYETKVDQYIANKLAREAPIWLAGSFNGKGTKDKIVIVVTPTSVTNSL